MASTDGSITFSTELDNAKLEKELGKLKSKIEKAEKDLSDMRAKRGKADEDSVFKAAELDAEKAKLQEIRDRLQDIRALSKDKSVSLGKREEYTELIPSVKEELADQQTRVRMLQNEYNKAANSVDRYDAKIAEATERLNAQKEEAGGLEQEIVSNAQTVRNEMQKALEDAKKAVINLEGQGEWFGDEEFDQAILKLARIIKNVKEYKKELLNPSKPENPFGLDTLAGKLREAQIALSRLEAQGKNLGDAEFDKAYRKLALLTAEAKEYQKQLAKTPAQEQREAEAIQKRAAIARIAEEKAAAAEEKRIDQIAKEAQAAAEASIEKQRLLDIAENAQVADQRVVDLSNELLELQAQLSDLKAAGVGLGHKEFDVVSKRIAEINQELKEYQSSLLSAKDTAADYDIQAADQLKEISRNAQVSNQHIAKLNQELAELNARQKELEQAGVRLGYQEYDQNATRIAAITKELKEYQKALQGRGQGGKEPAAPINRMALAGQKLVSILSKAGSVLKTIGSAAASAFKAVGKSVLSAAKGILTAVKNLNVFARLSKSLGSTMKNLGQSIKQAFIFSVVYNGLSMLKQQLGSYLAVNAEFSAALSRLKGVLLTAFQPIYDTILPALITLINILSRAIAAVAEFISVLFGTTAKRAQANAKALNAQAAATSAAGSAAEEASEQLAAFDEINKLEDISSSGGGGTGGSGGAETGPLFDWEYDDPPYESWGEAFNAFLDKILNGIPKLESAFLGFANRLNDWSQKVYEMFTFPGVQDKVILIGQELANAFNNLVNWIDWNLLGMALGAGLNLALQFLVNFLYTFDWVNLGSSLAALVNGAVSEIDWYAVGQLLWAGFKLAIETLAGFILGLDMPALAQAASELVIGFFNSITETLESIDWEEIGRQVREFLVNVDWPGIVEAVFGAIQAAFTASSDFFSGLLGEELKQTLTDLLIMLGEFLLVIGAILVFTGANVPLGLGLMAKGALALGAAALLDWEYVTENISSIVTTVLGILGGALLVIGTILAVTAANLPLGLGLMAAGAVSLATALAINWDFLPNTISGIVSKVLTILGAALLVLGSILTFSGADIPLGIGLMIAGAASLGTAVAVNWDSIVTALQGPIGLITTLVSTALLVLGAAILFSGANIPLGLGLTVAGAAGLATTISANWETIQNALQGPIGVVTAIASAALLALGVILLFTGAGIPLGLGLIAVGAAGLVASITPNWNFILEKIQEVWSAIKSFWNTYIAPAFNAVKEFFVNIFTGIWDFIKGVINGILGGIEGMANGIIRGINWVISALNKIHFTIPDWIPGLGGKSFGFNITKLSEISIPRLAQGAVIPPNREFLAVLGDQKSGNNIETPENLLRKIVREESGSGGDYSSLLQSILEAIRAGHIIMVDRRVLGQTVTQEQNRRTRASGRAVLLG